MKQFLIIHYPIDGIYIKKQEKPERESVLDGITKGQASLISAYKISKKAVKVGFEWTNDNELWEQFDSEIEEFKEAKTPENKEEELGDISEYLGHEAFFNLR